MITDGRTMQQAIKAGTCFEIKAPGWGGYAPPAAESPEEVLALARQLFDVAPDTVFDVVRIVGGTIGCRWVEPMGQIVA